MRIAIGSVLALTALAAGCIEDGGEVERCEGHLACVTPEAQRCLDRAPTVGTGFYGCVLLTNDAGEPVSRPFVGQRVQLFVADELAEPTVVGVSDQVGFYQLAPPPGDYHFCTGPGGRCSEVFTLEDGARRPVDVMVSSLVLWTAR